MILAPIFGEILAVSLLILNTIFFEEIPIIFTAISLSLPTALMGGWPCLFLGIYSYISSLTEEEDKTSKIGISSTIQNVAYIIGLGSSGFILKPIGFIGVYSICLIMLLISFIYGYLRIEEKVMKTKEKCVTHGKGSFLDIFRLAHLKRTLKTCCKSGKSNRKKKIFIILLLCVVILGPVQGEYLVTIINFNITGFSMRNATKFFSENGLRYQWNSLFALNHIQ